MIKVSSATLIDYHFDYDLMTRDIPVPKLHSWMNLPMPFPRKNWDKTPLEVVNDLITYYNADVGMILDYVTDAYHTSALEPYIRIVRLEQDINKLINQIFQERPSLP